MTRKKVPAFSIPPKKAPAAPPAEKAAAAISYVEGIGEVSDSVEPTKTEKQEESQPKTPKSSPLRRAEAGQRVVIYLPPELEQKLRLRAATDRRSMSDVVTKALLGYLNT